MNDRLIERLMATVDEQQDRIEALEAALRMIADIGEGSTTANSLPHIAKIARAALAPEQDK